MTRALLIVTLLTSTVLTPILAQAKDPPVQILEAHPDARITLSGETLPTHSIDLSTNDGLAAFVKWSSAYAGYPTFSIEDFPSRAYPKIACWDFVEIKKCRLLRVDGTRITYLDVDGDVERTGSGMIRSGTREYLFVGSRSLVGLDIIFYGCLIDLQTGARSKDDFSLSGSIGTIISPTGILYITASEYFPGISRITAIYSTDGKDLGSVPSGDVRFVSEHEVAGDGTDRTLNGWPSRHTQIIRLGHPESRRFLFTHEE